MKKNIKLRNSSIIGENIKPYFIAEMNTSHFGNMDIAKKMIEEAKKSGCDCVKFQSWSADSLYSKSFYDENPIAKRIFNKFALNNDEMLEVANYCKEIEIDFSSTPYSNREVDFLINDCNAAFIKIASMELNNYPYLDYIGKTGAPIILSTGMGELEEIKKAVKTIESTGNKNICILHCISIYPCETSTINLKNISGLIKEFPDYLIGYSDHSVGTEMASAAIALGACVIEKHFTLDSSRIGMDNQMASEPDEMTQMVQNCKNVQIALGSPNRTVLFDELEQRKNMRRSVIASKDLKAGSKISIADLDVKRPGTGIPPEKINDLVGKTLKNDVKGDTLIKKSDIS
jgi:sialic acid synthase SpsE